LSCAAFPVEERGDVKEGNVTFGATHPLDWEFEATDGNNAFELAEVLGC
jgi:hypothetical protein